VVRPFWSNKGNLAIFAAMSRFIFGEQLGRRPPARLVLEIDVGERVSDAYTATYPRSSSNRLSATAEYVDHAERSPRVSYFGRTLGSPPGLPGGGITGIFPVSGAGVFIPGSTFGGQITPPSSLSLSDFDESPGSAQGFWSALSACAQASETPVTVSASISAVRAMIGFTSE
jgi:hypothetical protein